MSPDTCRLVACWAAMMRRPYLGLPQAIRLMLQTQMVQLVIHGLGVLWPTRNIIVEAHNRATLSE